jgi:hypothetical protein
MAEGTWAVAACRDPKDVKDSKDLQMKIALANPPVTGGLRPSGSKP